MKTFISPSVVHQGAATTLTGPAATDNLAATATFVARPAAFEVVGLVEEDSTDIFTLERCSPLNDF